MRVFFPVSAERFMVWGYAGCWLVASSWPIGCLNESPVFFLAAAVFFLFLQMPLFRCPSVLWGPCEFFISSNITWKLSMVWTSNELESFQNIWGSMIPMEGDLKQRRRHFFFLMQTSKHQFILFLKYCRLKCPVCTTLTESSIQTWSRLLDSSIWRWLRNVRLKLFFCFFSADIVCTTNACFTTDDRVFFLMSDWGLNALFAVVIAPRLFSMSPPSEATWGSFVGSL